MKHVSEKERLERRAAYLRIADPASPHYLPFYARPDNEPEWHAYKRLLDGFGTHLICPKRPCRRAGHCADQNRRNLPFCFWHYRGIIRFFCIAELKGRGLEDRPSGGRSPEPEEVAVATARRPVAKSILERMRESGTDIDAFRRPLDAGECRWGWEDSEKGREAFRLLVAKIRKRNGLPPLPPRPKEEDEARRRSTNSPDLSARPAPGRPRALDMGRDIPE